MKNAEAIIRHGLQRYKDQVGTLWNSLSQYYIRSSLFERVNFINDIFLFSLSRFIFREEIFMKKPLEVL